MTTNYLPDVRTLTMAFAVCVLSSCDRGPEKIDEAPVPDFAYELNGDCNSPVLEVLFENDSKNAETYLWEFGDGSTSQEANPKKVYAKSGNYTVTLTASRGDEFNQLQKELSIARNSDGTGPEVSLSYERTNSDNLMVEYTISTNGLSTTLYFGDGEVLASKESKIAYHYPGPGLYTVVVTVENEEGRTCSEVLVRLQP